MPLFAWPAQFGGLDLAHDPIEVGWGGAIDLANVIFDREGRIRSRPGYTAYGTASANALTNLFYGGENPSNGAPYLFANGEGTATALAGGVWKYATAGPTGYTAFAHFGTPTAETTYALNGVAAQSRKFTYSTATWSNVTTIPASTMACVQTTDNRLVVAGDSAHPYRVSFSDAGAAETFGANNYVDLSPGDGEPIVALVAWRELVFAFKRSKFFVFYGDSTDGTGQPIFNFRPVAANVGPLDPSVSTLSQVARAGRNGVYFLALDGVYVTTGGPPQSISEAIRPAFVGSTANPAFYGVAPWFTSSLGGQRAPTLSLFSIMGREHLAFSARTSGILGQNGSMTFVCDLETNMWTAWTGQIAQIVSYGNPTGNFVLEYASSPKSLFLLAEDYTSDAGTAITSWYQSGFNQFSYKMRSRYVGYGDEKTIREAELTGKGTVSLSYARDLSTSLSAAHAVTLGTDPANARRLERSAFVGESISFRVSGAAPWELTSVVPSLREFRDVGEQSA